jgi:hypothetical protein
MGWSGPRNRFQLRMVSSGRLLFEGQEKGRDERPSADHDEERQTRNRWHVPVLRHQDLQDWEGDSLDMEGYCLKDKRKVEMKDPQPITMKNGKPATVGTCPICGTKIYRIGKATA